MKKEIISCKKNENGSCSKKEKIIQEPDDGFVEHQPGEYRKGYGIWFYYETDTPHKTRPFVYIFSAIFILLWSSFIGFVMFNVQNAVAFCSLGIFLLGGVIFPVYCCYHCLKRIRQIEIELYQKKKNKQNKDIIS